jgi:mannose-6-phosphate isomerase-like protein (cupin superfamily)
VTTVAPAVISSEAVEPLHVLGEQFRPLVTGAAFEVFDVTAVAEAGPPPHAHPWDEGYVVLEGRLAVQRGTDQLVLGPGDSVHVPASTLHAYRVISERIHFLTITAPSGAGEFFADMDANVQLPPDMAIIAEVAARHQLTSPLFGG